MGSKHCIVHTALATTILHRTFGVMTIPTMIYLTLSLSQEGPTHAFICFAYRWRLLSHAVSKNLFSIETHPLSLIVGPYADSSKLS